MVLAQHTLGHVTGFEKGLKEWRRYLKPGGGYIAVSEASWFTDERPAEIEEFWMSEYPGIDTVPNKLAHLQQAGYKTTACFCIPDECWTDHFYAPQVAVQQAFLKAHAGSAVPPCRRKGRPGKHPDRTQRRSWSA